MSPPCLEGMNSVLLTFLKRQMPPASCSKQGFVSPIDGTLDESRPRSNGKKDMTPRTGNLIYLIQFSVILRIPLGWGELRFYPSEETPQGSFHLHCFNLDLSYSITPTTLFFLQGEGESNNLLF